MMLLRHPHYLVPLLTALLIWNTPSLAASDQPRVVTSLAPLELLVKAVAGEQVATSTLVPAGSSPHTYQLRPSERRRLADADLVFWVGPGMETFLQRLLTGPDFRDRSVALMPGEATPEAHEHGNDEHGHDEQEHDHGEQNHDSTGHRGDDNHEQAHADTDGHTGGHDHGDGEDPHVWLDPALAMVMAEEIAQQLKGLDGVDASAIDDNLAGFRRDLSNLEADIREQLAAARTVDLFTYHDAFTRFAEHYGLSIAGVLTLSPERTPGARHLAEVQQRLRNASQPCLLTEPQFDRQWWRSLMEDVELPLSTWDPLAADIEPSARGYLEFQQSLADAVLRCLPENAE